MSTEYLMSDIGAVLDALMGSADESRQEAERHLRRLTIEQPAEVLLLLAQIGAQGVGGFQLDHRLLTLILLKRLAFKPLPGLFLNAQAQHATAPFDVVREVTRGRIETVLCAGLKDEMDVRMRKGLGVCAASWAQESAIRHRPLLPLPPVLLELTTSPQPFHRFTPFQLLDMTPTLLVDSVSDPLPADQLAQILLAGLNDPSVDVRVEAMKAMRSVLMEGVTGKEREQIGAQLVLQAFQTLPQLPPNLLSHALVPLVDLASLHPHLYIPSLSAILPYLLSLLSPPVQPQLQGYQFSSYPPSTLSQEDWEEIANPATEIILSLAELRYTQIGAWEGGRVGREMVGLLIGRQVSSFEEDCQDWVKATNLDEEDEDYPIFAEEAFDRLAMALGGEAILPSLSEQVQPLLAQSDWRCRYSALIAIASIAEGCLDELQPRIRDVLTIISPTAKDPHPRVRYGFLQCIGQLCTDCDKTLQTAFTGSVLEICLTLLDDPIMRVRAHSAACMTNFFQDAESTSISPFLEPVIRGLVNLYQSGPLYAQEQVLATLSNVAISAEHTFTPYYRSVMDLILHILATSTDKTQRKLQGRAMECASMAGMSVGKSTFAPDAVKLAQLMIGIQNQVVDSDDCRTGYLMEAWSTLCRTLGDDFTPFLTHVVPPLLKAASYKPPKSSQPLATFEDTPNDVEEAIATANTAEMDEKVLAYENLTVYAFQMRARFEPWLGESMALSLEGLTFPHSEAVREAAAFLVPGLLQVAKDAGSWNESPENLVQVFQSVINAIVKEQDWAFLALLYKSFTDSLHVIATPLPPNLSSQLLTQTKSHLSDLHSSRTDREAQSAYMDEADIELYLEEQRDETTALDMMGKSLDMVLRVGAQDGEIRKEVEGVKGLIKEVKKRGLRGSKEYR
ncbi:hypothetical protein CI109_103535 [Kwoniella shandongensis]|uniref:Uncharacterized protein n=1 Tax=Kwoniella shandongensis TaxID=1734106 RepID=A0A5M6BVY4_9TREE|nr:uncharacterized protein CI109_004563 [Kwoniella shandongensis]KAA5527028.1 hypothetical protein CI109_004563 [Kwoniella shandongensis]